MRLVLVSLAAFAVGCAERPLDLSGSTVLRIDLGELADGSTPAPPDLAYFGPPSCAGLAPNCGPTASSPCCESPLVPGGTFYRGVDVASDELYSDRSHPATVSDFRLDKYEITVGRFRAFVDAGGGTQAHPPRAGDGAHPKLAGSGWDASWNQNLVADTAALSKALQCIEPPYNTWTGASETLPIVCLTWYEAAAFCAWDGGFLPTEAEANYAAAGGAEQRAFPWSIPPGSLSIDHSYAVFLCGTNCSPMVETVGSRSPKGDGRWTHSDLEGNVTEWVLDWFGPYPVPCNDCANLVPAPQRVFSGGTFTSPPIYLRTGYREADHNPPTSRFSGIGARCARNP